MRPSIDKRLEIAILGGSFDPPHIGHMLASMYVIAATTVDRVLWIPVQDHPWGKESSPYAQRVMMCQEALQGFTDSIDLMWSFSATIADFAYEQVREVQRHHPTAVLDWIIGSDIATEVELWEGSRWLRNEVRFRVVKRDDSPEVYPEGFDMQWLPMEMPRLSSTSIRAKASMDVPIQGLVTPQVRDYILQKELYKKK